MTEDSKIPAFLKYFYCILSILVKKADSQVEFYQWFNRQLEIP